MLVLFSSLSTPLYKLLQSQYQPLELEKIDTSERNKVNYVIVLGCWHSPNKELPAIARLSKSSLSRLTEGIRCYKLLPNCKLILSGGRVNTKESEANMMGEAAQSLGIPADDIILEDDSKNTMDEAMLLANFIGKNPFVLVTSASHTPRAINTFKKLGMRPIAAPADFVVGKAPPLSGCQISHLEVLIYEVLGNLWYALKFSTLSD